MFSEFNVFKMFSENLYKCVGISESSHVNKIFIFTCAYDNNEPMLK